MYYHTDCGHIIRENQESTLVSDEPEDNSSRLYLDECPTCERRYPYIRYLDESICEDAQTIVYRLQMCGFNDINIPEDKYSVSSIRVKSARLEHVKRALDTDIVDKARQWDEDVLISLSKE